MGRIDDLIQQYCPEGVPMVPLGDLLKYEQPTKYIVQNTNYDDSYTTPVLTAGQSFILGFTNETDGIFSASIDEPVIIFDDFVTSFHWVDFDFKVKSSAMKMLRPKNNTFSFRYVYYAMCCIGFIPSEHTRHWISRYSQFEIPLPPLPIQEAIVEILEKIDRLSAELQAELQARKQQYEYYRNQLLTRFAPEQPVTEYSLGEIADLRAGKAIKASELGERDESHLYPCFGGNGIRGYISKNSHQGKYPIIGRQGALCGCVNWAEGKFYATEHAVVVSPKNGNNPRYLYYMLEVANLNQYKSQGAQPGLSVSNLNELKFNIPPLSEQARIVAILDKFEAFVNDLSQGLPAEIAAVQEQYEYYRNKLLTFKTKE